MNRFVISRGGLLSLITGVHVAVLWAMLAVFNQPTVQPPVVRQMVMAEILPAPKPEPLPIVPPAPPVKREPVKQPKPTPRPQVKPAPIPTPNTTPSEQAISAPPPEPPQPAPAPSAPAEPAPAPAPAPAPVVAPRFDAAYLNNPAPAYPALARRMGEEGRVLLRVHVTPEGTADEVRVHTGSNSSLLDEAAQAAVRKWRFVPARQGGNPVAAWVLVPVVFKLN